MPPRTRKVALRTSDGVRETQIRELSAHKAAALQEAASQHLFQLEQIKKQVADIQDHPEKHEQPVQELLGLTTVLQKLVNGVHGFVLGSLLWDEDLPVRPREQLEVEWGVVVYDTLFDRGWSHGEITSLFAKCMEMVRETVQTMHFPGSPSLDEVAAIMDFGAARTEVETTT